MITSRFAWFPLLCLVVCAGCSNVSPELSKPTETVTWPELQALQSPDISMGIIRPMQMRDFKTMKTNLADPKIEELVKKFEASTIPSKFASKAREDAKGKVVSEYKMLISAAKGTGSNNDLKSGGESLLQSLAKLQDPNLK